MTTLTGAERTVQRLRFRAMGTDGEVIVVASPETAAGLAHVAESRIEQLEQRWSRFRPDSEVSRLNRCAGETLMVSDDTVELIHRGVDAWLLSGGSVDPTVLGAVIRAGYDRSFELVAAAPAPGTTTLQLGCGDIEISGNAVRLPAGTGFDPGGIGKGLAADLVAAETITAGATGVCVNLGGDLRVIGESPRGAGWTVAVEHAWAEAALTDIGLAAGAVATSTTLRRRWPIECAEWHHLIDPGTGLPSATDLTSVTVVAGAAWMAEVLAKAVLLRGSAHPFDLIGGLSVEALAVDDAGRVVASDGFGHYTSTPPPANVRTARTEGDPDELV